MDFWKAIYSLVRQKTIGPPLVAAGLVAAALVFFLMPTTYVSTGSMVLTTPASGGTLSTDPTKPIGLTNPLLQFSDGLKVTAGILILSLNTDDVMTELGVEKNGTTKVTIDDGRSNPDLLGISTNGPFVYVQVESRSPATTQDVLLRAKARVRKELANRQQALRAPRSTFITIVDVVPSSSPEARMSSKLAVMGGVFFGVILAGIGIAYGVAQRRAGRTGPAAPPGAGDGLAGPRGPGDGDVAAERPAVAVYATADALQTAEGPFQDDSTELVVVVDDAEEPFAHDDQGADTIVFMRAGGRDDYDK
ncbi:hypothetical protein [Streptosporangium sp. NPDC051022]|uniref:hypothetical protein n=1 Tax=Streptosporangium sp. NPDC051022 TaxID=3155752 RepID=UPI00343FED49